MSVFERVLGVVRGMPPPEPDASLVKSPPKFPDSPDMNVSIIEESSSLMDDHVVIIKYEDAKGNESTRRIRVKSFSKRDDVGYLHAYCFERKAPRSFKLENIVDICDANTGEFIEDDPFSYFEEGLESADIHVPKGRGSKTGMSQYPQAYSRCYPGIKALAYIARCDGEYHQFEVDAIMRFVNSSCTNGGRNYKFDGDMFRAYAENQCPDFDGFERALKQVWKIGGSGLDIFYRAVAEVVDADGEIDREETNVCIELKRIFKTLEIESWNEDNDEPYPY